MLSFHSSSFPLDWVMRSRARDIIISLWGRIIGYKGTDGLVISVLSLVSTSQYHVLLCTVVPTLIMTVLSEKSPASLFPHHHCRTFWLYWLYMYILQFIVYHGINKHSIMDRIVSLFYLCVSTGRFFLHTVFTFLFCIAQKAPYLIISLFLHHYSILI